MANAELDKVHIRFLRHILKEPRPIGYKSSFNLTYKNISSILMFMNHLKENFHGTIGDWRPGSWKEEAWIPIDDEKRLNVTIEKKTYENPDSTNYLVDCEVVKKDPVVVRKEFEYDTIEQVLIEISQYLKGDKPIGHLKKFVIVEESIQVFQQEFIKPLVEEFNAFTRETRQYIISLSGSKEVQINYTLGRVDETLRKKVFEVIVQVCQEKSAVEAPKGSVKTAPRNYVETAPRNYVETAPRNYVETAPRNYVETAPRNYFNVPTSSDKDHDQSEKKKSVERSRDTKRMSRSRSPHDRARRSTDHRFRPYPMFTDNDQSTDRNKRKRGRDQKKRSVRTRSRSRSHSDRSRSRSRDRSRRSSPDDSSKRKRSRSHSRRSDSSHSDSDRSRSRSRNHRNKSKRGEDHYDTIEQVLIEVSRYLNGEEPIGFLKRFLIVEKNVQVFSKKFITPLVEKFNASTWGAKQYIISPPGSKQVRISWTMGIADKNIHKNVFEVYVHVREGSVLGAPKGPVEAPTSSKQYYDQSERKKSVERSRDTKRRSRSRSPHDKAVRSRDHRLKSYPMFSDSDRSRSPIDRSSGNQEKRSVRSRSRSSSYSDRSRSRSRDRSRRSSSDRSDSDRSRSRSRDRSRRLSPDESSKRKSSRSHRRRSDSSQPDSDRSRSRSRSRKHRNKSKRSRDHKKSSDRSRSPSPKNFLPADACEPLYREIQNILNVEPNIGYIRKYVLTRNDIPSLAAFVLPLEKRFGVTRGLGHTIIPIDKHRDIQVTYQEVKHNFEYLRVDYKIRIRVCKAVKKNPNAPKDEFETYSPYDYIFDEIDKMICTNAPVGRGNRYILPKGHISHVLQFMEPLEKRFKTSRKTANVCFVPIHSGKIVRVTCWENNQRNNFRIHLDVMKEKRAVEILKKEKARSLEKKAKKVPPPKPANDGVEAKEKIDKGKNKES